MERAGDEGGIGFRRWYERQLLESHAWLVTCVLCLLAVFACLEQLSLRLPLATALAYGAFVFAAGVVAVYGFARYRTIMTEAERCADRSTCAVCREYGRFRVPEHRGGAPFDVRCRGCGNRWRID
jgi:hypothetical protein